MKHSADKTRIWPASTLVFALTLTGCASALSVPPECPRPPELPVREPLGPSYQDRMRDFLSGKLPEQTDSEQPSQHATNTQTQ